MCIRDSLQGVQPLGDARWVNGETAGIGNGSLRYGQGHGDEANIALCRRIMAPDDRPEGTLQPVK